MGGFSIPGGLSILGGVGEYRWLGILLLRGGILLLRGCILLLRGLLILNKRKKSISAELVMGVGWGVVRFCEGEGVQQWGYKAMNEKKKN